MFLTSTIVGILIFAVVFAPFAILAIMAYHKIR